MNFVVLGLQIIIMNAKSFYGKGKEKQSVVVRQHHVRPTPMESDDSELSGDDKEEPDDEDYVQPQCTVNGSSSEDDDKGGASQEENEEEDDVVQPSTSQQKKANGKHPLAYKWRRRSLNDADKPFTGNTQLSAEVLDLKTPLQFFRSLFTLELEQLIVDQSNLFATQTRPEKPLKMTQAELQQFLGSVLLMSLIKLPSCRKYWSSKYKVDLVAENLSNKRFEEIKRFLHFTDNTTRDVNDRLWKVRPVLTSIRDAVLSVQREKSLSVDEQIVPFKGKSSLKQYNPRKPHRWGYKIWVLSGVSGFAYDFEVYSGETHEIEQGEADLGPSSNVVVRLCRIPLDWVIKSTLTTISVL
jgi:hypothetical protein